MTLVFLEHQPDELHAPIMALLQREAIEMAIMLHLDFASAPVRICNRMTSFVDLETGHTWEKGGGLLVGMPDLDGGAGQLAPLREFVLGMPEGLMTDAAARNWRGDMVDLVGDVTEYRGRAYGLYGQLFDAGQPVGYPFAFDVGLMDRLSASFVPTGAVLTLGCEGLLARKRVPAYGMQTYLDQKRRYPTDEGFQFVTESGRLIVWTDW